MLLQIQNASDPGINLCKRRFRMFVDGKFAADGFTSNSQLDLSMTVSVSSSRHQLRVAKIIEPCQGEAMLEGIQLSPGGR